MGEKKPYFDELDDVSADDVVIATEAQFDETTTSRTGATALRWVLTLIAFFLYALLLGMALGYPDGRHRELSQTVRSIHQVLVVLLIAFVVCSCWCGDVRSSCPDTGCFRMRS